jgi:hypothetical protein
MLQCQSLLVIHILGGDSVIECASAETIRNVLHSLIQWLSCHSSCPKAIRFVFIGPDVPIELNTDHESCINLLAPLQQGSTHETLHCSLQHATVHLFTGLYHEWLSVHTTYAKELMIPDMLIAFNAGIWGYDSWIPTLEIFISRTRNECLSATSTSDDDKAMIPFIVTSYTLQEAEDDYEVLHRILLPSKGMSSSFVWNPERNRFASRLLRPTETASSGHEYFENHSWQALLVPRKSVEDRMVI